MASVQEERESLQRAIESVPPSALPNLRRIVELFADSVSAGRAEAPSDDDELQAELRAEMEAWDKASDEALAGFEQRLTAES